MRPKNFTFFRLSPPWQGVVSHKSGRIGQKGLKTGRSVRQERNCRGLVSGRGGWHPQSQRAQTGNSEWPAANARPAPDSKSTAQVAAVSPKPDRLALASPPNQVATCRRSDWKPWVNSTLLIYEATGNRRLGEPPDSHSGTDWHSQRNSTAAPECRE